MFAFSLLNWLVSFHDSNASMIMSMYLLVYLWYFTALGELSGMSSATPDWDNAEDWGKTLRKQQKPRKKRKNMKKRLKRSFATATGLCTNNVRIKKDTHTHTQIQAFALGLLHNISLWRLPSQFVSLERMNRMTLTTRAKPKRKMTPMATMGVLPVAREAWKPFNPSSIQFSWLNKTSPKRCGPPTYVFWLMTTMF